MDAIVAQALGMTVAQLGALALALGLSGFTALIYIATKNRK